MANRKDIPTGAWNLLTGPWALNAAYANTVVPVLNAVDWAVHMASGRWDDDDEPKPEAAYTVTDGIAALDLNGPMTRGRTSMQSMFGGTSTLALRKAMRQAAADPNVSGILLRVDSPGGEVDGTADLAAAVKAAGAKKPVLAYVDGAADSAAYWTASQATEVWAGATSRVGSIGTYTTLTDSSEAARAEGFRVHVVKAGAHKGTGVPGTEITPAALSRVQETVNGINDEFLMAVQTGRGLSAEAVAEAADGEEFHARRALDMGLIDSIGSEDEAMERLRAMAKERKPMDAVDSFRALLGMGPRGADMAGGQSATASDTADATPEPAATLAVGTITEHPLLAACREQGIADAAALKTLAEQAALGEQYTAAMRAEAKAEYIRAVGQDKADPDRLAAFDTAGFKDARNARDLYRGAADAKFGTGRDEKPVPASAPTPVANVAVDVDNASDPERLEKLIAMTNIGRTATANGKGH